MHNRTDNNRLYMIKNANLNCSDGNSGTSSCDDTATSDELQTSANSTSSPNYLNSFKISKINNETNLDHLYLNNLNNQLNLIHSDNLISKRHLYNSVGNLASTDQFISQQQLLSNDQNSDTFTCRVQYLNDLDAFSLTTLFPEPSRPPLFQFNVNIPLINQLPAVHRLLKAPHRVGVLNQNFLSALSF